MNAWKFMPLVLALALTACGDKNEGADTADTGTDTTTDMTAPDTMPDTDADTAPETAPADAVPPAEDTPPPAPEAAAPADTAPVAEADTAAPAAGASAAGASAAAGGGDLALGEKIYSANCVACHATGVAGAPKIGDKAAWEPHLAKGIETLHTNAIKGINAMPPKGGNLSLSDDETKAAVDYMVSKVS